MQRFPLLLCIFAVLVSVFVKWTALPCYPINGVQVFQEGNTCSLIKFEFHAGYHMILSGSTTGFSCYAMPSFACTINGRLMNNTTKDFFFSSEVMVLYPLSQALLPLNCSFCFARCPFHLADPHACFLLFRSQVWAHPQPWWAQAQFKTLHFYWSRLKHCVKLCVLWRVKTEGSLDRRCRYGDLELTLLLSIAMQIFTYLKQIVILWEQGGY